ncbi:MAG: YdeI/OmpD-associated family protein [Nannocystaceae bacterium]|nr:YdeI/OmpD-associated family protein [Nannocystaceae bacterium]
MNKISVDAYLKDGCGRCDHYKTPQCKVHQWTAALEALRKILLASGLTEEMKWGSPCYTLDGKNVVLMSSFKEFCSLNFFKGALLTDENSVLEAAGPNTRSARLFKFTEAKQVRRHRALIVRMLNEAIALQKAGTKLPPPKRPEPTPDELQARLDDDAPLRAAFDALTPGRQRSYILHVSGAKQSKTRATRAERCVPKILLGKGFNER